MQLRRGSSLTDSPLARLAMETRARLAVEEWMHTQLRNGTLPEALTSILTGMFPISE